MANNHFLKHEALDVITECRSPAELCAAIDAWRGRDLEDRDLAAVTGDEL
jgi:hypothetical protein